MKRKILVLFWLSKSKFLLNRWLKEIFLKDPGDKIIAKYDWNGAAAAFARQIKINIINPKWRTNTRWQLLDVRSKHVNYLNTSAMDI